MTMMRHPRGVLCDRARAWAALAPDGELSELERKLLGSHLDRCVDCADFAVRVSAVAAELRAASLQPLPRPISVRVWRRRPAYARVSAAGAAAAVAVMALGVAARAPLSTSESNRLDLPRVTNFANNAEREVELIIRRAENDNNARTRFRPKVEGIVTRPI
jgi:ferric-dicitrate binding protein FerR (iron transport regulator)